MFLPIIYPYQVSGRVTPHSASDKRRQYRGLPRFARFPHPTERLLGTAPAIAALRTQIRHLVTLVDVAHLAIVDDRIGAAVAGG